MPRPPSHFPTRSVSCRNRGRLLIYALLLLPCRGVADCCAEEIPRSGQSLRTWLDAAGKPSPLHSDADVMDYLRSAKVLSSRKAGEGVSGSRVLLLEKGGLRMHAIFRHLRQRRTKALPSGRLLDQRDDCVFEPAAYELSRMLGLDSVPPAIIRDIEGKRGSLQVWIEKAFTEKHRMEKGFRAPDEERIRLQYEIMGVFDNLIYNDDRNRGNILFDSHWKLWMIDHTRAFRPYEELPYPRAFSRCEVALWENLKTMDPGELRRRMTPFLEPEQIEALVRRREALIERIEELLENEGESRVLFTLAPDR